MEQQKEELKISNTRAVLLNISWPDDINKINLEMTFNLLAQIHNNFDCLLYTQSNQKRSNVNETKEYEDLSDYYAQCLKDVPEKIIVPTKNNVGLTPQMIRNALAHQNYYTSQYTNMKNTIQLNSLKKDLSEHANAFMNIAEDALIIWNRIPGTTKITFCYIFKNEAFQNASKKFFKQCYKLMK